jgi:uncharacterized repeat protein (TIGR03803 family)
MKAISTALIACALGCVAQSPIAQAATESVLYSFCNGECNDGSNPEAGLLRIKNQLYGTTPTGGVYDSGAVFSYNLKTGVETALYSFGDGADGQYPIASLINVAGTLYGTTYYGGTAGDGTVFSLNLATGIETVLYSFCGQQDCTDGESPRAALVDVNGMLYGTTQEGGANGQGVVFSIDPTTGAETVLHSFGGGTDGIEPFSGLLLAAGALYGTTFGGGASGNGTVYSIDPQTGTESVLYSFTGGSDGGIPEAGLIKIGQTFYGTTNIGGASNLGTVFSLERKTGVESVLHSFGLEPDGASPAAGLINVDGTLYGTTFIDGDKNSHGTVFSVDPQTGAETVLHSFCDTKFCEDGEEPLSGVIDVKGTLYGTTFSGGVNSEGVLYSIVP